MIRLAALLAPLFLGAQDPDVLARHPDELPHAPEGRWEGFFATAALRDNVAELPDEVRAGLARAEERYRAADYPAALDALFATLTAEPDVPPGWLLLGTSYFRLRRYSDAVFAYERFLALAPGEAWRTQGLGHAYYSLGRYEEARAHYERVLERLPESVEAVRGMALCHVRLGREERALELLERALALAPEHVEALTWKARVLYALDRSEEALPHAERACALAPWSPAPRYARMQILYDLGRDDEARAVEARWRALDAAAQEVRRLEALLRRAPRDAALLGELAGHHADLGHLDELRTTLERFVAVPATRAEARVRHARALDLLVRAGDESTAAVAARSLEAIADEDPTAWRRLHRFYTRTGDAEGAARAADH